MASRVFSVFRVDVGKHHTTTVARFDGCEKYQYNTTFLFVSLVVLAKEVGAGGQICKNCGHGEMGSLPQSTILEGIFASIRMPRCSVIKGMVIITLRLQNQGQLLY